jgi:hypothetical protein
MVGTDGTVSPVDWMTLRGHLRKINSISTFAIRNNIGPPPALFSAAILNADSAEIGLADMTRIAGSIEVIRPTILVAYALMLRQYEADIAASCALSMHDLLVQFRTGNFMPFFSPREFNCLNCGSGNFCQSCSSFCDECFGGVEPCQLCIDRTSEFNARKFIDMVSGSKACNADQPMKMFIQNGVEEVDFKSDNHVRSSINGAAYSVHTCSNSLELKPVNTPFRRDIRGNIIFDRKTTFNYERCAFMNFMKTPGGLGYSGEN